MQKFLAGLAIWMLILSKSHAHGRIRGIPGRKIDSLTLATLLQPMAGEPSCEDLRLMWRFSRRQNRVAEITNEIPTYRDPFAVNVWEELPRPKPMMVGSVRSGGGRSWHRPVFGRVVENAPRGHPRISVAAYQEFLQHLANNNVRSNARKPPVSAFRLTGGVPKPSGFNPPGGFQNLKKLIWDERAKELQEQRLQEESAARELGLQAYKSPISYNRAYGFGKQYYREPVVNGEMRYFENGYRTPASRYRSAGYPIRKTYRYNPLGADEKMARW